MTLRPASNLLIAALPRQDRLRLLGDCETIELARAQVLCEPGARLRQVYFPLDAFISLATVVDGHAPLEVGMVGNEGMFGIPLVLGAAGSPLKASVLGAGSALRIGAAAFRRDLAASFALRRVLLGYIHVTLAQFAESAACTHVHLLDARLARWLLMASDRAHSDQLHFTQDAVATLLGVRRVGVTNAAGLMQRRNLLRYSRGAITILDRPGLIAMSCGCYQAEKTLYDATLG
jgi:CRP-like cAMP-binding protein